MIFRALGFTLFSSCGKTHLETPHAAEKRIGRSSQKGLGPSYKKSRTVLPPTSLFALTQPLGSLLHLTPSSHQPSADVPFAKPALWQPLGGAEAALSPHRTLCCRGCGQALVSSSHFSQVNGTQQQNVLKRLLMLSYALVLNNY